MSVMPALVCNQCHEVGGFIPGLPQATPLLRGRLTAEGWQCAESLDLCPKCAKQALIKNAKGCVERFLAAAEGSVAYNEEAKEAFHRNGRLVLQKLAKDLGLATDERDIRSNMGGIAVSGEVTLHGGRIYVQLEQSCLGPGEGILVRTCQGRKDYTGGQNHWLRFDAMKDWKKFVWTVKVIMDGLAA